MTHSYETLRNLVQSPIPIINTGTYWDVTDSPWNRVLRLVRGDLLGARLKFLLDTLDNTRAQGGNREHFYTGSYFKNPHVFMCSLEDVKYLTREWATIKELAELEVLNHLREIAYQSTIKGTSEVKGTKIHMSPISIEFRELGKPPIKLRMSLMQYVSSNEIHMIPRDSKYIWENFGTGTDKVLRPIEDICRREAKLVKDKSNDLWIHCRSSISTEYMNDIKKAQEEIKVMFQHTDIWGSQSSYDTVIRAATLDSTTGKPSHIQLRIPLKAQFKHIS